MQLWFEWYRCVRELRQACSRNRTFLWRCLVLVGFSIRTELFGVTSFVRSCFLRPEKYRRLLHLFHTTSLNLDKLSDLWCRLAGKLFSPVRWQGYRIFIADGLKVPKEGKKMPAVKALHQESQDNSKPSFIMGHSFQAIGMLAKGLRGGYFCVPLVSRIHEGLVWSNRDRRTLLDKLVGLFLPITKLFVGPAILLADAYYASGKVIRPLLREGHHLVTRVRTTTVGYLPIGARSERNSPKKPHCKRRCNDSCTGACNATPTHSAVCQPAPEASNGLSQEDELPDIEVDLEPLARWVRAVVHQALKKHVKELVDEAIRERLRVLLK